MQGATYPPRDDAGSESSSRAGLTNAGAGLAKTLAKGSIKKFVASPLMWLRLGGRGVQFVFALIVCGFYGARVNHDRRAGNAQAAAWCYALFVAGLSAATAAAFAVPFWKTHKLFLWDALLFVLWIAAFGTFARKFLSSGEAPAHDGDDGVSAGAMKLAAWLDLLNAVFWLLTAVYGFVYGYTVEKGKGFGRLFAGKATGRLGDLEAGARGRFDDKLGDRYERHVGANPLARGAADKVGAAVKAKAAAKLASKLAARV